MSVDFANKIFKNFFKYYFGNPKEISGMGDGTVIGAIKDLNDSLRQAYYTKTTVPWTGTNPENFETRSYYRYGNIVTLIYHSIYKPNANYYLSSEQVGVPEGFRPPDEFMISGQSVTTETLSGNFAISVKPEGNWEVWVSDAEFLRRDFIASWITHDPFPVEYEI